MNQKFSRWMTVAALAIAGATPLATLPAQADDALNPTVQVAAVDQLKVKAFQALRVGNFDAGNDYLDKASKLSSDPQLAQMHEWTNQFDDQLKVFAGERHKAYNKAVEDVKKLLDKGHADFALDFADRAQLLSDDKKAFHDLPWMHALIAGSIDRAANYEKDDQWAEAGRVYSDLAAIEPASKEWKEKLKSVTRHGRLLATYCPDVYRKLQEQELKELYEVDALLNPTTQPATRPADPLARNENFKIDWHETLKGVRMDMLVSAMHSAYQEYYRDVNYRGLMTGGLAGIDAILNTKGLDTTFPSLADEKKRDEFQKYLDGWKNTVAAANADNEEDLMQELLSDEKTGLLAANARTLQLPPEMLISEFADGALPGSLDPFSTMIWPTDVAEFTKATQGEFSGIGIQILPEENGDLRVVRPLPNSPAEHVGIHSGDVISEINGKSAKGITSDEAVKNITGPSGTMVKLTIRSPDGASKIYNVRREKIKVESVEGYAREGGSKWNYYIDPSNKIAYIKITGFSSSTVKELDTAIHGMGNDVNGIIIDLRGNPGGLLQAAIGVCDEFLKEGTIVSTHPDRETRNSPTMASAKDDGDEFTKPLVVLVNQYSASASEIVSGALKDDHRALLVGQRTFGKGSVQQIFPLDGDAILKLTTAHYYLPSGRCIHREENSTEWGVDPDVTVEMTPEQMSAAQDARESTELGRDVHAPPAEGKDEKMKDVAPAINQAVKDATSQPTTQMAMGATTRPAPKTLLQADPQLAAALLVIRLEMTGAHI